MVSVGVCRSLCNFSSSRLFVVDAAVGNRGWLLLLLLVLRLNILLFLDGLNWLLVVVHLLLHVGALLLFLNNLIHEDGLVDAACCIQACCALSIPLDLVLLAQWDGTK